MNHSTTGELIDDGFYCRPSADVQPLPPEVLQHWGLLASPFAPAQPLGQAISREEFYFRTAAHAATLSWLQNLINRPASLGVITTSSGAGTTTFLRQLQCTAGIGHTAIETAAAFWNNQSLDQLSGELSRVAGAIGSVDRVRTLWIVQTPPPGRLLPAPNRIALLSGWYTARARQLNNLSIVVVVRRTTSITRYVSTETRPSSHCHLARLGAHELRRCVASALHHAGGTRPAFTVSAVTHLADTAAGSIRRLGTLVHAALLHGHLAGLRQISRADLSSRLNEDHGTATASQARAA